MILTFVSLLIMVLKSGLREHPITMIQNTRADWNMKRMLLFQWDFLHTS